jgi:hypothetical protein
MTIWLLSSFTFGVLVLGIPVWFARRAVLEASKRIYDSRQARAVGRYRQQFSGCRFSEVPLKEIFPSTVCERASGIARRYGRSPPRLFVLTDSDHDATEPSAYTTFFFLDQAPVIILWKEPEDFAPIDRFILYHELGHAAGFQTSHFLGSMILTADLILLGVFFAIAGTDHYWGLPCLAAYVSMRFLETARAPGELTAEANADLWGLWGAEIEGFDQMTINEVLEDYRSLFGRYGQVSARLKYAAETQARRMAELAEEIRSGSGSERDPVVIETSGFEEALDEAERELQGGPDGLSMWRFSLMLVTTLAMPILLGISLATVHFADYAFWRLTGASAIVSVLARFVRGPSTVAL